MNYLMLPCYNEENAIVPLLRNVEHAAVGLAEPLKVVIVDDGSSDNSIARIKEYAAQKNAVSVEIMPHGTNKGLGQAMRTGVYHLAQSIDDEDIVFTMDADNTHNPDYMIAMRDKIRAGNEVVVASRYCPGGEEKGLALYRSILSRGASTLLTLVFHCKGIRDYTCGYRAYKGRLLKEAYTRYGQALITEDGFTCMAELLIKVHPLAHGADEIPMVLRYDLKGGKSKMKIIKTIVRYWHVITTLKKKKIHKN